MLTNNYLSYIEYLVAGTTPTFKDAAGDFVKASMGTYGNLGFSTIMDRLKVLGDFVVTNKTSGNVSYGVFFGSGSTPASRSDYTIESILKESSGLSNKMKSVASSRDDAGNVCIHGFYSMENTNATAEISISELCLFGFVRDSSEYYHNVLVDRTVLENPIVLKPGEEKLITYKFTFGW